MDSELIRRRNWFEDYFWKVRNGIITTGPEMLAFTCACCGYPTLSELYGYEICALCGWEDDGQDDPHADEIWGGPNYYLSLTDGRNNFIRYLSKHTPDKRPDYFQPESWKQRYDAHKRDLMDLYDRIMTEPDPLKIPALWKEELPLMHIIFEVWKENFDKKK